MEWKILILVLVWNRAVYCLPFEICCPNEENAFAVDTEAKMELYFDGDATRKTEDVHDKSLYNSFQQVVTPIIEFQDCDESCCRKKFNRKSWNKSKVTDALVRTKRFPLHLDPLYQYRFLSRSGQCPTAKDGQPEFYCPTPDKMGNWRCIDDFQLCDGVRHCPNGEDELPVSCLFYRVIETHLNSVSQRLNNDEIRQRERKSRQG